MLLKKLCIIVGKDNYIDSLPLKSVEVLLVSFNSR